MSVSISASVVSGIAPLVVHFAATGWTNTYVDNYQWDFGDGSIGSGIDVHHEFKLPGVYTVTFAAKNALMYLSETASVTITVSTRYVVLKNDLCYRLGLGQELQGMGPSEFSGESFPMLPVQIGGVECVDKTEQVHQLLFDNAHGAWCEIGMFDGPTGSGLAEKWTDDDVAAAAVEILPRIELPEITGESEHFQVEGLESFYYFRPIKPGNRSLAGYSKLGLRNAQKILISLYIDGSDTPNEQMLSTPTMDGKINFNASLSARRARVAVDLLASEFVLVGYTQYWKVRDIDLPPGYSGADR
jgi:PKD repeat protein